MAVSGSEADSLVLIMPQLDGAAYLSQVTWLVVLFGGYYLLVLNGLLPSLSRRRKVPAKKLRRAGGDQEVERRSTVEGYEASLARRARESAGLVQRCSTAAARWRAEQKGAIDQKSESNGAWAAALGEAKGRGYARQQLVGASQGRSKPAVVLGVKPAKKVAPKEVAPKAAKAAKAAKVAKGAKKAPTKGGKAAKGGKG